MASPLYFQITSALSAHWKAHGGKYPQRVLLTPAQHQGLCDYRHMASTAEPTAANAPRAAAGEKFMGVLIEHAESTPGVMIGVDGVEIPLQAPPAPAA